MGYTATGSVRLTIPEDVAIPLILSIDTLPTAMRDNMGGDIDVVRDVLENICMLEVANDSVDEDAEMRTVVAYSGEKWFDETDDALKWFARLGVGVHGYFVGEDLYAWEYENEVGEHRLRMYGLEYVREPVAKAAAQIAEALNGTNVDLLDVPEPLKEALAGFRSIFDSSREENWP